MARLTLNHKKPRPEREKKHFIKEWRTFKNFTSDQLGEAAKLTGSFISQLERSKSAYTQNSLEAIAEALGVSPGQLLDQDPYNPGNAGWWSIEEVDPELWHEIPEEHHHRVVAMYKVVREKSLEAARVIAREQFLPRPWKRGQ